MQASAISKPDDDHYFFIPTDYVFKLDRLDTFHGKCAPIVGTFHKVRFVVDEYPFLQSSSVLKLSAMLSKMEVTLLFNPF